MAEIHMLPTRLNLDGATRLRDALIRAFEDGVTGLGPRAHHIRSLGYSIEQLSRELRYQADVLATSCSFSPLVCDAWESLDRLADQLERLAVIAVAYPL